MTKRYIYIALIFIPYLVLGQVDSTKVMDEVIIDADERLEYQGLSISPIDSLILQQQNATSLADLLSNFSPVFIKSYGQGSLASISFRGTGASHTQVLWNGLNINSPSLGQVDFSQIPTSFINNVALYHGGSSVGLGNGGLGGSITLASTPEWNKGVSLKLGQVVGSFGTYRTILNSGFSKKRSAVRVNYYRESSENNFSFTNPDNGRFTREKQRNGNYLKQGFTTDFFQQLNEHNVLSLHTWYLNSDRNIPSIIASLDVDKNESQKDSDRRLLLEWRNIGDKYTSSLKVGTTLNDIHYRLLNNTIEGLIYNSFSTSMSTQIIQNFDYDLGKKTVIKSRLNAIHEHIHYREKEIFNPRDRKNERTQLGGAISVHHQLHKKVSLYSLLRQDIIDGQSIPTIGSGGFRVDFCKHYFLSYNITNNYHVPTLNDLYWYPGGNDSLQPEQGVSHDIKLSKKWNGKRFNIKTTLTYFNSRINNWILWSPTSNGFWTADNLQKVYNRGLEVYVKSAFHLDRVQLTTIASYGYTLSTNESETTKGTATANKQLIYIQVHKGNFLAKVNYKGFEIGYNTNFESERFTTSSNDRDSFFRLPFYQLHRLSIGQSKTVGKGKLHGEFSINNLFHEDYQTILSRPMPGRNYLFSISYSY